MRLLNLDIARLGAPAAAILAGGSVAISLDLIRRTGDVVELKEDALE
jgi:hypothetical protein